MAQAFAVADRIVVMEAGRIVETGEVSDIFANAAHPATKRMLAALAA